MAQNRGICGIELGKDTLAVVHYLPREDTITEGHAVVRLETDPLTPWKWWDRIRGDLKPTIRDVRHRGGGLQGCQVVCSLPAEHAVVTKVLVESDDPDPQKAMRWELAQHLVGGIDEYVCSFQKLNTVRPGPVASYLAAAYRATWVTRTRTLLRGVKLVPRALDLDVFALVNAFEANYRDIVGNPAFLVLGGDRCCKVILTWNGTLVDYEFFEYSTAAQSPREFVASLQKIMGRLRASYPSLTGRGEVALFASGVLFTYDDFATECFRLISNIQLLNPFRNVGTSIPESRQRVDGPRLGVAVGLAIRESMELMA